MFQFIHLAKRGIDDANDGSECVFEVTFFDIPYAILIPIPQDDTQENVPGPLVVRIVLHK